MIKKANKGDTIVIETTENYIQDGLNHLSNTKFSHRFEEDIKSGHLPHHKQISKQCSLPQTY